MVSLKTKLIIEMDAVDSEPVLRVFNPDGTSHTAIIPPEPLKTPHTRSWAPGPQPVYKSKTIPPPIPPPDLPGYVIFTR